MGNIVVFDTETTSLEKPFCYNVGYVILNEKWEVLKKREFVIEQVWHNLPLFHTAYYANKRPLYISRLRVRDNISMEKFGYVTQRMSHDFSKYEVTAAYAYNSPFDDKVFQFNCDWFKVINPFDNIPILDIRGVVHAFIAETPAFHAFCDEFQRYTESGNYSTTAETLFQYISRDTNFAEDHTALSDAEIEAKILQTCSCAGAIIGQAYEAKRSIARFVIRPFIIKINGKIIHQGMYIKKYIRDDVYSFTTPPSDPQE